MTVSFAKRSFYKLKSLKFYLKSTMIQTIWNALVMNCIENEFLKKFNYEILINDLKNNARR